MQAPAKRLGLALKIDAGIHLVTGSDVKTQHRLFHVTEMS